jgi:chromate transporter
VLVGPWLVLAMIGTGLLEVAVRIGRGGGLCRSGCGWRALAALVAYLWQSGVLGVAAVWLLAAQRGVVSALLGAGILGVGAALIGWPVG